MVAKIALQIAILADSVTASSSSESLNAASYHRVVKPDSGSAGIVLLLNEKTKITTSGAYRNSTSRVK